MRGLVLAVVMTAIPAIVHAEEPFRVLVTLHDHRFVPSELHVPANTPVVIDLSNEDATAEEFDSNDLRIEKVVAGGRHAPVRLRPLAPGRYTFVGEYHSDTALGVVIAAATEH